MENMKRKLFMAAALTAALLAGCVGTAMAEGETEAAGTDTFEEAGMNGELPEELPELPEGELPELPEGELPELPEGELPEGLMGAPEGQMTEIDGIGNVAYAGVSESQICDIYTPDGDGPFPVIVLAHGGGFLFGDQRMPIIQPVIDAGLANGYAVVSVDYRKSGEAAFPAAVADMKAAVRYVRANAEEYGFDAEHVAVWGESAGAYLSLMTALTPEVEELNGDVEDNAGISSAVNALVDFYGPVEFYTLDADYAELGVTDTTFSSEESFESQFLGQAIGADEEATYQTYWETYKDQLPEDYELKAWIQVGDSDQKVPYLQSEHFAERLSGVLGEENVEFSIIEGADHEDDLFYTDENLEKVFEFLDGIMK